MGAQKKHEQNLLKRSASSEITRQTALETADVKIVNTPCNLADRAGSTTKNAKEALKRFCRP